MPVKRLAVVVAALVSIPGLAQAQITAGLVFVHAAPAMKLVMVVLIGAMLAAIVITTRKVIAGPNLVAGSAFIRALRAGGPLLGLLGAAYNALGSTLGISNVSTPVTLKIVAPGLAEMSALLTLGLLAGVVAVICHWIIDARIDRGLLKV